ncbi:tRNA (uracil-5-)-methyltransferase [Toxoplasma gondii ME49]|uniref:tRNA (Uracil-5-)-methyltransferase n=9 Tax=Toxoplasma gondii TaxID=5811 RepID=B6KHN4_TOXGV|nr:tRNA (uracil-5-)-methyltransferase [Toxoplasma gondii ME49]EPT25182.1 tRNA (uracil-5-)-methyltransferase [Toxoplasma gondii ME49]ESS34504.1 tRNA (uracil-5-)-methyltransferase [Toxoplasma gondii VEG]CEL78635.1 TPA: tRNA (uracil-5-)-methyltransferase homolog A [Toxoplasma gondii VEG]|eukprot:XP_002367357.1 tRNA (uracil-5-)-methyltransferase [Toxoplasma gondii ME49]
MESSQPAEAARPRRCHLACRAWSGLKQEKLATWMAQQKLPFLQLDKKHQAAWAFIDFASKEQEDAFTALLSNVFFKRERIQIHPAHPRASVSSPAPPKDPASPGLARGAGASSPHASGSSGGGSEKRTGGGGGGGDGEGGDRTKPKRRRRGQGSWGASEHTESCGLPATNADSSGAGEPPHVCGWRPGSPKPRIPSLLEIQRKRGPSKHSPLGEEPEDEAGDGADTVAQRTTPLMRFSYQDQLEMKRTYLRTHIRQLTRAVYTAALQMGFPGLSGDSERQEGGEEEDHQSPAEPTTQVYRHSDDEGGAARPDADAKTEGKEQSLPWFHPQVAKRWNGCEVLPTVASPPAGRLGYRNKCEFTIGYTHEVEDSYDEKLHQCIRLLCERQKAAALVPQLQQDIDGDEPWCTVLQHKPRHCLVAVASQAHSQGDKPRGLFLRAAGEPENLGRGDAGDSRGATAVAESNAGPADATTETESQGDTALAEKPEETVSPGNDQEHKRRIGRWMVTEKEYETYLAHRARVCVGFVKRVKEQQPLVAPASGSLLVSHAMQELCVELQAIIHRSPFPVYNRRTQKGVWRLLMVRSSEAYRELQVLVQVKSFASPNSRELRCGPLCARGRRREDKKGDSPDVGKKDLLLPAPSPGESPHTPNGHNVRSVALAPSSECGVEAESATPDGKKETDDCCRRACIQALVDGLANKQFDGFTVRSVFLEESDAAADCIDPAHPTEKIWGADFLTQKVAGLDFSVGPHSFFQTNTVTCGLLYQTALNYVWPLPRDTPFVDVCSGTGTIALCAAAALLEETGERRVETPKATEESGERDTERGNEPSFPRVVGIEMVEEAVRHAKENADRNHMAKYVDFICGKAEDVLPQLLQDRYRGCTNLAAIVDPPRAGLHSRVLDAILDFQPIKRLVYVSCNPTSMVANCIKLCTPSPSNRDPFVPMQAVAVDMFPHTLHCEGVLLLCRLSDVAKCRRELATKARESPARVQEVLRAVEAESDRNRFADNVRGRTAEPTAKDSPGQRCAGSRTRRRLHAETEELLKGVDEAEDAGTAKGRSGRSSGGGGPATRAAYSDEDTLAGDSGDIASGKRRREPINDREESSAAVGISAASNPLLG